jgi:tetratricopeptide (TPR) repeat protein
VDQGGDGVRGGAGILPAPGNKAACGPPFLCGGCCGPLGGVRRTGRNLGATVGRLLTCRKVDGAGGLPDGGGEGSLGSGDAYVDLGSHGSLTGTCAALQIKGGSSFGNVRRGYRIPTRESHRSVWRESTIPVIGIVYDPRTECLHWVNITEFLRVHRDSKGAVPVPAENRLVSAIIDTDFRSSIESTPPWIPRSLHRNLPAPPMLIGRQEEVTRLGKVLSTESHFVVIEGIGGVGKTAIALNVAHALFDNRTVDRVVWASSKGRTLEFPELLDLIATGLDQPYLTRCDITQKQLMLLQTLSQVACLVVVDNLDAIRARAKAQINRFLAQVKFPSRVIVTTRPPLPTELFVPPAALIVPISGLKPSAARELATSEATRLGITLAEETSAKLVNQLLKLTDGNPLAIIISFGQLTTQRLTLPDLVAELQHTPAKGFDYLYGSAWQLISKESRQVLCAASLFAGSFTKEALFAIAAQDTCRENAVEVGLAQLIDFGLIRHQPRPLMPDQPVRLELHPLTKSFAETRLSRNTRDRRALYGRLAIFYEYFAEKHKVRFWGGRENYGPLEIERDNLLATLHWCVQARMYDSVAAMCASIADFLVVRGDWNLCLALGIKGAEAARIAALPLRRAWILVHMIGYILANRREFAGAESAFLEAIATYKAVSGESEELSEAFRNLGRVQRQQRRWNEAQESLDIALRIAMNIGNSRALALALNEVGKKFRDFGNSQDAADYFQKALAVLGEKDSSINAGILCNLAGVQITLGHLSLAREHSAAALKFFSNIDNAEGIASTKWRLSAVLASSDPLAARKHAEDALRLFKGLGMVQEVRHMEQLIFSSVANYGARHG